MSRDVPSLGPRPFSLGPLSRPLLLGILNVTPDSFSDGGRFEAIEAAVAHAHRMIAEGADVLDIGGESTRPGARRIDAAEQLRRIMPVIERLRAAGQPAALLSIDTTLAAVAEAALDAGVSMINDVSAGRDDPAMFPLAARRGVPIVLMHMQGGPATMQAAPHYDDVVVEVKRFLLDRADAAIAAGVARENIILDPGLGFGKNIEHNLTLLAALDELVATGYPVLIGASRKRFLGEITGERDPSQRAIATAAVTALAVAAGVKLLRVHDVLPNRQAADVTAAVMKHRTSNAQ